MTLVHGVVVPVELVREVARRLGRDVRAHGDGNLPLERLIDELVSVRTSEPVRRAIPPGLVPHSVREAATVLGVTERTVTRRCTAGTLPALREGKSWLVLLPAHGSASRSPNGSRAPYTTR